MSEKEEIKICFGCALQALKLGRRVSRRGWNGKGMWLRMFNPYSDAEFLIRENGPQRGVDSGTAMPWIGIHNTDNQFTPWTPSQGDMLSEDWEIDFSGEL